MFAPTVPSETGPGVFSFLWRDELNRRAVSQPIWLPHRFRQDGIGELKAQAASEVLEGPLPQPVEVKSKRIRILLADDHETVRTGVRIILGVRKEYDIVEVANGADALAEIGRSTPDLVILDLTMPGLDGFTVAQEIRKRSPQLPILFFSMHQLSPALLSLARSRQVQGFVCKSESGAVLAQAVEAVLANKEFFPSEPDPFT